MSATTLVTSLVDKIHPTKTARIPELADLELVEETDVRGFDTGLIVDKPRKQVTVNMGLPVSGGHQVVAECQWRHWEDAIGQLERMVATATIDEAGDDASAPRIATTFRAVGKTQRKDIGELVTDISLRAAELYERAEAMNLPIRPLTARQLADAARTCLTGTPSTTNSAAGSAGEHTAVFGELATTTIREQVEDIIINDYRRMATFSIDISDDNVAAHLDQIMADWSGEALLRRTRFFRPYVLPEGTGEDLATGSGRRWAIVTVIGNTLADVALRGAFDATPALSLSMRRMRGRQRIAALAATGIGVLGFQHITSAMTTEPNLEVN
ncbi:hypothetical protein [Corynebacterium kalidii]